MAHVLHNGDVVQTCNVSQVLIQKILILALQKKQKNTLSSNSLFVVPTGKHPSSAGTRHLQDILG